MKQDPGNEQAHTGIYRRLGQNEKAQAAVAKYRAPKAQADQASARNVQDFLKLNQANAGKK